MTTIQKLERKLMKLQVKMRKHWRKLLAAEAEHKATKAMKHQTRLLELELEKKELAERL